MNPWIVLTTIRRPTPAVLGFAKLVELGWRVVVVGDTASPPDWRMEGVDYLSVERQNELFGELARLMMPYKHYSRKNLGYLYAIREGASLILESDDDNLPYPAFGENLAPEVEGRLARPGWVNVYALFTEKHVWPRGFPLEELHNQPEVQQRARRVCPIQQFLVDEDPDVDAIYRLVLSEPIKFEPRPPVILPKGTWCPFNSQNTLFFPAAFPCMYLPCFVNFRVTDIWRSFVAQAAVHSAGLDVAFLSASAYQSRNEHDLLRDFEDEIPGYLSNRRIVGWLEDALGDPVATDKPIAGIVRGLWEVLVRSNLIPVSELNVFDSWLAACAAP
jgi:hypothetical protein